VIRKHFGFGLNMGALLLFFPGILLPMFALDMEMAATLGISTLSTSLVNKELSILDTVRELWDDQRILVAALIFIFSICIPLLKTSLILIAYVKKHTRLEARILNFVAHIGKWSMADVFVVAVFLAILSTQHSETADSQQMSLFGFKLMLDVSTETLSAPGLGFYYFSAYCVVSLLGTHLAWSSITSQR
jgi:paraquat-inducible protein A